MAAFVQSPIPNLPRNIILLAIDREGDANSKKLWPGDPGKTKLIGFTWISTNRVDSLAPGPFGAN